MSNERGVILQACAFARAWTWLYTCGVDRDARETRRCEVESDLWESVRDARAARRSDRQVAGEVIARVMLGVADDLLWRFVEAPRPLRRPAVWWATTAVALGALTVVTVMVLIAAAPAKLPFTPAPEMRRVRMPAPPPPPPPPTPADLR